MVGCHRRPAVVMFFLWFHRKAINLSGASSQGLCREVVGDEHLPVLADEVAEEGAPGLEEAVVCHVPNLQRAIAGWYWLVFELQDFGQSAPGLGPPRLFKMVGEVVEDENLLDVVAATPQAHWWLRAPVSCRWRPGRGWTKIELVGVGFEVGCLADLVNVVEVVSKVFCLDDLLVGHDGLLVGWDESVSLLDKALVTNGN